ncbi:succinylglutamate desuccinylase/aspartoacylase family protein [Rhodohalobacter mucosus]|uniref:Succinylglutamate desuccinylase n=1 Tax=Rhodohalobacter mucosus TaxID=2079485 RepID=A0A316TUM2_9BACT|nr:succinylglutamate desuccinylase/aspartoacylase family protein [Rhodohalobacter mucosus]PWN07558.1 succinylglutamate desuccinylase [Rhodohalobacter mucosus]
MPDIVEINGERVSRGEDRMIEISISRLPTYTDITLPVRVIRAKKDGPVLLLSGGMHGDEINGIEIVRRMIARNMVVPETGTVIAVPLMNVYGFIQNVRGVPDGKDINRSFPGVKGGSLAKLVAYSIMKQLIPAIDYGIDFHTGGASRSNYPQIRCSFDNEKNLELARAFAPPVILHSPLIQKTFRKAAFSKGKRILVFETGESLRLDQSGIREGIEGTLRLMRYLGMIEKASEQANGTELYMKSSWIRARYAGLFHPKVILGDHIKKRQVLGFITDPYGNESFRIVNPHDGRIIGLNNSPVIHKGDALFHIARNKT